MRLRERGALLELRSRPMNPRFRPSPSTEAVRLFNPFPAAYCDGCSRITSIESWQLNKLLPQGCSFFAPGPSNLIDHPHSSELDELCARLASASGELDTPEGWPGEQLRWCGDAGVYRWFFPEEAGGLQWDDAQIYDGYLQLSAACLTTTFVITQRMGACRRMLVSDQPAVRRWLRPLLTGEVMATVGISHLTTSRQHVAPVLRAVPDRDGFRLNGEAPWVTGGRQAELLVVGATCDDGEQILAVVPSDSPGVVAPRHVDLVALTASQTGKVEFHDTPVPTEMILAGPAPQVMKQGVGAKTGGLQTSVLAAGVARRAVTFLTDEAEKRAELHEIATEFHKQVEDLSSDLLQAARGFSDCSTEQLRTRANSLVLRSTQAALSAAKGAGFTAGHPVGRWCREALFFLVWSCPQGVLQANLCELAQIGD